MQHKTETVVFDCILKSMHDAMLLMQVQNKSKTIEQTQPGGLSSETKNYQGNQYMIMTKYNGSGHGGATVLLPGFAIIW